MGSLAKKRGLGLFYVTFLFNEVSFCRGPLPLSSFLKNNSALSCQKIVSPVWYQELPTIGLRPSNDAWNIRYPFIPHQFSLWQMAPRLGKGVTLVFIDSGIRAKISQDITTPYLFVTFDPLLNYNVSHKEILQVIEELELLISSVIKDQPPFDTQYLCNKIVLEYVQHHTQHTLRSYLVDFGGNQLWESKARVALSQEGKSVLKRCQQLCDSFHAVTVIDPETQSQYLAVYEFLPLDETQSVVSHGTAVAALAAGRRKPDELLCGIAPHATSIMIKAFSADEQTSGSTLCAALIKAVMTGAKIVNMSLARTSTARGSGYTQTAELLMSAIPYSVAAVENKGGSNSFPATADHVTFSIGAFGYNHRNGEFPLVVGGQIVLPGVNILIDTGNPTATKASGTSFAAPLMSGFLALMLSEFDDETEFTRDQLLKTCCASTVSLMGDTQWAYKTKGDSCTLDMRMALFTLHILRSFKRQENITGFLSTVQFDRLLKMIRTLLLGIVNKYSLQETQAIKFESNFCEFYKALEKQQLPESGVLMKHPIFNDFSCAIAFCVDCLRFSLGLSKDKPLFITDALIEAMQAAAPELLEKKSLRSPIINEDIARYAGKADILKIQEAIGRNAPYWRLQTTAAGTV